MESLLACLLGVFCGTGQRRCGLRLRLVLLDGREEFFPLPVPGGLRSDGEAEHVRPYPRASGHKYTIPTGSRRVSTTR